MKERDSYETCDVCLTPCLHPNPHIETRNQPIFHLERVAMTHDSPPSDWISLIALGQTSVQND